MAEHDLNEIWNSFNYGQILKAYEAYERFSKVQDNSDHQGKSNRNIEQHSSKIQLLVDRYMKVMKCLSSNEGLDWTLGSEYGGLKAFYQKQEDGSISACVHGQQDDVPIFEQVAILSDVERYSAWIPLISQSNLLAMPGKLESIFQSTLSTPFLSRDSINHMWTADCLTEHNTYICFGKSIDAYPGVNIPAVQRTLFHDRCQVNDFWVRIKILNSTSIEVHLVININLNASLPQWLISFLVNNLLSIVMSVLKQQAIKMVTDQEKFEGAIRARSFPIVVDHFLPRAQEFWKQNKWINPPQQVDSHGKYLPPFLQSVVAQKRSKSTSSNSESKTPPVILDLPQAIPKKIPEKKLLHYGVLWKLGQGFLIDPWAQRFFVLDFQQHTLTYYSFHSSLQSLPATTPTSSSSSGLSSSSLSSGDVPNSLSSLLLNDPKKVQKGVINLENKKILFYVNDKYSIHWFNSHEDIGEKAMISSTSASASVPRGTSSSTQTTSSGTSSSTPPTTYTPLSTESNLSSRDSYIIEIIYLKSVPDSKRSNMILLTYNYQIGKEWAQALTYVTALATKYSTKKTVKRSKKAKGKKEDPTELEEDDAEFNELRDEVRDSLASYHGLIPPMGYNPLPPHQL